MVAGFPRSHILVFQRRCSCRVLPVGGLGSCAWSFARQETNVNSQIEGRCLCGAVRFIARGEPTEVSWCHCQSCRRHTGAPASAFVAFRRDAYAVTEGEITKFNSSPGRLRGFCARCGSTMTCEGEALPEIQFHIGTFTHEDASRLRPTKQFFAEERLPWVHPTDDPPR
jgi:hypothetical protein